ncbi:TetR family transcriptional regulator [Stappia sp. 28M-7]|uniref:TetR family transcriptional regulator n=1 Tax=Stappia sp. 28M-7 TaxID=2762596 RepID=UPI00163B9B62|nr:TetR family transcriptional regulator [Stappia sp. 28M-7]MBC2860612.1 TetR family transcriptional regulator [Stappia sp. 28M-7]
MATAKTRQKIVASFLSLLGDKGWHGFEMADVAREAGVKLSVLRAEFPGKTACLRAFLSDVDQKVLDAIDPDMEGEPARERLFDVLMTRLDTLSPHKDAIRALRKAVQRDPQLALKINREAVTSQRWMLTAAGIPAAGPRAAVMSQALVVAFARVVDVWLDDKDPGLARTMSALARQLDEGEVWMGRLDRVSRFLKPFLSRARERGARQETPPPGTADAGDEAAAPSGASPNAA